MSIIEKWFTYTLEALYIIQRHNKVKSAFGVGRVSAILESSYTKSREHLLYVRDFMLHGGHTD